MTLSIEGFSDTGSSQITVLPGNSLNRSITVRLNGNLVGGARPVSLSLSTGGLNTTEAYITPTTVSVSPGQSAQASLRITPSYSQSGGAHQITVTARSGNATKNFTFTLTNSNNYTSTAKDLQLVYNGPTSLSRGSTLNATFSLRETSSVSYLPTSVRMALYDPMVNLGSGDTSYGYQPYSASDTNYVIATKSVLVEPGYNQNSILLGGGFTFSLPGTYKVCGAVDIDNALIESSESNNVSCGTVLVF